MSQINWEHDGPCWLWTGNTTDRGYPQFRPTPGAVPVGVHRWMLQQHLGRPLGAGMEASHAPAHICGHRNCVNPDHLSEKSHAENMRDIQRDGTTKGRPRILTLSERDAQEILDSKLPPKYFAQKFGIHPQTVWDIRSRKTWRQLVPQTGSAGK